MTLFNRRTRVILLASALTAWMPGFAHAGQRPSNDDVKALINQVDEARDKFEGNLDGAFKGSTLRGPAGEAKVSAVLQDYQDNTQKLKDRFSPDYSASAEVATVLKQSTAINTFMDNAEKSMKGRSEWAHQVGILKRLAEAYGTTFPLPDGATVRRMNDKETAAAAAASATAAGHFKNDLDKDKTLAKPDKELAKKDVEMLVKRAEAAKSRISGGEPATSEVQQLVDHVARLQTFVDAHPGPGANNWRVVQTSLAKLQQAFGLVK